MANQDTQPVQKNGFGDNIETDMKAFYDSLELSEDHFRPSDKTKKAIYVLQGLFSKELSLLRHPVCSVVMKDTLKYLHSLPPEEGLSIKIKSQIQWLLQSFVQCCLKHDNASKLSITLEAELSKACEVKNDLEANVKEFHEMDKKEKNLCNQLAMFQEEKRKLEKKIEIINGHIDRVGKEKIELYQIGREEKAKMDDLLINVERMKAEQQSASKIEAEWFELREQFIRSTGIKEWI
jgi:hypothetical protein